MTVATTTIIVAMVMIMTTSMTTPTITIIIVAMAMAVSMQRPGVRSKLQRGGAALVRRKIAIHTSGSDVPLSLLLLLLPLLLLVSPLHYCLSLSRWRYLATVFLVSSTLWTCCLLTRSTNHFVENRMRWSMC